MWLPNQVQLTNAFPLRNANFDDSIHSAIGIEKNLLDLHIYPNPGSGIFHLQIAKEETLEQISIRNIEGRLIQNIEHDSEIESGLYEIDLSAQQNGMYFISIKTAEKQATEKLILMR